MISVPVAGSGKGPYSVALEAHGFVFLSGQGGFDDAGRIVSGGVRAETTATLQTIERLLLEAGLTTDALVNLTCYLADIDDWPVMNEAFVDFFGDRRAPTRTAVEVARLPFNLGVEITAVAVRT